MPAPKDSPLYRKRRAAEDALIDEISRAAQCIADARDSLGQPVFRTDSVWRVLTTVARSHYCLAIADLGRALRCSRQAATRVVRAIRQRLERNARELAQRDTGSPQS